jgi:hypothetical protein
MSAIVSVPIELLEAVAELHLRARADQRLQQLMDRNTNGSLTAVERAEFETLVEWSEAIAPLRAQALHLLGCSAELRTLTVPAAATSGLGAGCLPDDELTADWIQLMQHHRAECDAADRQRLEPAMSKRLPKPFRIAPLQKLTVEPIEDPAEQAALDELLRQCEETLLAESRQDRAEPVAEPPPPPSPGRKRRPSRE